MTDKNSPIFIVGIGASAGGLKPIEDFFDHMPSDTGMAFVVVQHLSPDFKSLMDELLARHTDMPIHKVVDGVTVEPNSIYLIPPKKSMAIEDGKLRLTDKAINSGLNLPIDVFFRSLAQHVGKQAVGIILSGTGSDGSRGIKDIHEQGGLVLVQSLETVSFDGMPRAAISSGVVDLICSPEQMPEQLVNYADTEDRMALQQTEFPEEEGIPGESAMKRIFRKYRQMHNLDFSMYKPATIKRRIERRMQLAGIQNIDEYVNSLSSNPEESENLYRDLLVEVTHFFRDPEAFEKLRDKVIPDILAGKDEDEEIRVWVAGCATGEEAFSTAIVIYDAMQRSGSTRKFKVFATDVHRKSLEVASAGFYPSHALDSVPQDLQHYFVKNNGICNVKREIRQSVIFAANDLTRDPPFTRLDLVTCRNVLIYLEPQIQKRVLAMFHFGLRVKGALFLGPSETVGDLAQEFETVDRHWRIYSKRRDVRLPESTRMPLTPMLGAIIPENPSSYVVASPARIPTQVWLNTAYEDLLAKHVPPSLLVDESYDLVHCFGDARKLLSPPEGKPSNDVIKMLEKDLGVAVSAALHRAKAEGIPVTYKGIRVTIGNDDQRLYRVTVEPYRKTDRSLYLISLEETEKVVLAEQVVEDFSANDESGQRVGQLERELNYTRETLQATVEELESSNEELQATNEELIASNEELQSTNEELHSVNEELYTVNAEHQEKITELTEITVDMDNLLRSTEIGTIFLDKNFAIRMFTPSIEAGFNVLEQDIGRSINDIAYKLDNPNLLADTSNVLENGTPMESEVRGKDGKIYLQRIQPYIDDGEVQGIVLTLTDISATKEAESNRTTMRTLTDISQELPDFAYAVSHDLQAPLRHISQYTQMLESAIESGNDSDVQKASQVIKTSSDKMRTMIDGLLAYSRVNTQGKPLEKLDLATPINDAIHDLRSAIDVMKAEIIVEPDLPQILGDARQLQDLFVHLIDNAMKYRSDENPVIKISCEVEDEVATISVSDNGIGVADRDCERIFTIFKRLGFKEETPGAGVGLAICRRIVLRHHGQISMTDSPDTGSTIQITLPTPLLIRHEHTPRLKKNSAQQQEV